MDKEREISRLIAYANELGITLDIKENFSTRFKLQKLAFFTKVLYDENIREFGLYKRGPYSSDETTLYYGYADGEITVQQYKVREENKEKLKMIFSEKDEKVIEGAATVIYLIKNGVLWKNIYTKLKQVKPNLSTSELVDSVNLAKEFMLTEEKLSEIRKEAREEAEAWEEASLEDTADTT